MKEKADADKGVKGKGLSRFKKMAKKVVSFQRFPWNMDILSQASQCDNVDQAAQHPDGWEQEGGGAKPPSRWATS